MTNVLSELLAGFRNYISGKFKNENSILPEAEWGKLTIFCQNLKGAIRFFSSFTHRCGKM
jgi:hypothetical protein